ncbi:cysteine proteinase [Sistotremastrum niveocremeum HHB9708]|uniref:Cysteine proteinase n=1 Tax=Sistotremastrum niveocremeum HHB9708 TaxID=1314777 RepID=A0A164X8C1_9AGAM|nr:cysteine proteinase [Sistotremastrum niveocremeum HHB9708]
MANELSAIDHTLPTTHSGKQVCAIVSAEDSGATQLFPAMIEKAFMKLHGGYEFPGSNSGADLQTLIGWIPETIDLRSNQFARETTWSRFRAAYERGDCLATLGTGKQPVDMPQRRRHLLASHSYPILDISSDRMVSILDSWEGTPQSSSPDDIVAVVENLDLTAGNTNRILKFSWEEICEIFDTLYLSWNPAIWKHQTNLHRTWKPAKEMNGMPINHSMTLGIPGDDDVSRDEICVLLIRHLMDKTTHSPFVALHVGQAFGRIQSSGLDSRKQTYTDSSHVLRRVQPYSNRVSIVTSIDDCSSSVHYTLTVLSNTPVSFDETPDNYLYSTRLESAFTLGTAGGNIEHPTFMINPQWHLKFLADPSRSRSSTTEKPKIRITLEAGRELPLNACLAWSSGERITELVKGDIVADTGEYSYGLAAFAGEVKASDYTLIVSSFSPRDLGDFALTFESSSRFELEPIRQEGAGMFKKVIKGAWEGAKAAGSPRFGKYEQNPVIDLTVSATCQMKLRLRLIKPNPSAALNVTVFQSLDTGQGKEVLTSGPYSDAICGTATKATTLPKGKYVMIPSTFAAGIQERWELIVYHSKAEVKVALRD